MLFSIEHNWSQLESYLRDGGFVMLPLVMVSLLMWVLIVDRLLFFRRLRRKNMSADMAWNHIRRQIMPDPHRYRGIVSLLVAEFIEHRSGDRALDRFILDERVAHINRRLKDYLALIGVLAAIAPLLGLLGTVTGMIATFDVLAVFGTGNAKALAGGISQALITTQTGLLVAIPGLYMKGFLDRRAINLTQRITTVGYFLRRHI